ncbi:transcription elongation factor SPT6, partial [Tanacetum coccineum]
MLSGSYVFVEVECCLSRVKFIDLLDDTRIHPESYGLAQELAKDMYTEDAQDEVNDDEDMLEMAIEHVRENPTLLRRLEVVAYAKSKKRENKKDTLNHIRLELIHGFQDWRRPYANPSEDEAFYMLCGETEETLAEEDYSDDSRDNDLTERLNE